ncbi:conserved hypothetical protein [Verrucomicrobia bacterium]|nr:conserved hypothetical protein [Verrucomicrobiota bacterium]
MVIFGTGVVTGGLLVRFTGVPLDHRQTGLPPRPPSPAITPAGGMRLDFLRRMGRELNLSPEQRERIDAILRESQERSKKIIEPVSPQLREEVKKTKAEFIEVLTPEQRKRFADLAKQQQHRQPAPQQRPLEQTSTPPVLGKPVAD